MLLLLIAVVCYCKQLSAQTLDTKFATADGPVYSTLQNGDTVYIGGSFSQVGIDRKKLARFKPGSITPDQDFPGFGEYGSTVSAIESDSAGGFYLAGNFYDFNGTSIDASIIHVLSNGSLDPNFKQATSGAIYALKKVGNKLYVGGSFYYLQGEYITNLGELNATTGDLDSWRPDLPGGDVTKIDANDSLIFIKGYFSSVGNEQTPDQFAALKKSNGKIIPDFPSCDALVTGFKIDKNTLYVGGNFNNVGYNKTGVGKANQSDASLNLSFPSTNGNVWCIQPDGRGGYYIGGSFTMVGNLGRNYLAHILPGGAVDLNFYADVNNIVYCMATDSTNLYFGGDFTQVNGAVRNHAASVTLSTGSLTKFDPDANGAVYTLALYGGTVYMGGGFSLLKGKSRNYAGAVTTKNVLTPWSPSLSNYVYKILINTNGSSAFLGGTFTTVRGKDLPYLAKVNTTTGAPSRWRPAPNNLVNCMALNGNVLYIKGLFYSVNGQNRQGFAAIDTGSNNPTALKADINNYYTYSYGFNDLNINNGKLYIAGAFTTIQDSARTNIARLDLASGIIDNWNGNKSISPNNTLLSVCADRNDVIFGGAFNFLGESASNHMAAIDLSSGNFAIKKWQPQVLNFYSPTINDIVHYGNTVFAAGAFSYDTSTTGKYSYVSGSNLIALDDSTGKIIHQFTQYPNEQINQLKVFDNKLIASGYFSEIDSIGAYKVVAQRYYVAGYDLKTLKLSPDTYDPNYSVHLITDSAGNLVMAGDFTLVKTVSRFNLAALDLNTGLPTSWNPFVMGNVMALAIKDSTLFLGGQFSSIGTDYQSHSNLAAVSIKTGKPLQNWSADVDNTVYALTIKDNTLYVGGAFNTIKNVSRNYAAAVKTANGTVLSWDPNPDGTIYTILPVNNWVYLGGNFYNIKSSTRQYLAKVSASTAGLSGWNPNPDGIAYSIINSGRNIFVGGSFQNIGSKSRYALAAFDTSTNALTSFNAALQSDYPSIESMTAYGRNLYFGISDMTQTIGDSTRGSLAGIDTVTKAALAFNPMPSSPFYGNSNNFFFAGRNKLFVGGYWYRLGSNISPSNFAVFTLEPQNQASALSFTNIQTKSAIINFTSGGGESRIVVVKEGGQPSAPTDGKAYMPNTIFKKGDSTASQSFVVYNGKGNNVNVTNLIPGRSYTVSVYEYNGSGNASDYLTYSPLTGTFTTPSNLSSPVTENKSAAVAEQLTHPGIYPNPAANECTITFFANGNENYTINILNLKGNVLMRNSVASTKGMNNFKVNISNLAAGTYIVSINDQTGKQNNLKLIKQ